MTASTTKPDDAAAFLASLGIPTVPVDRRAVLTIPEWAAQFRISASHARRLAREAADQAKPLPDGRLAARFGRTYRIVAA
jgi:ABC-type Fe3+-hydroxamate transport system substrate-binding protein